MIKSPVLNYKIQSCKLETKIFLYKNTCVDNKLREIEWFIDLDSAITYLPILSELKPSEKWIINSYKPTKEIKLIDLSNINNLINMRDFISTSAMSSSNYGDVIGM